MEVEEELIVGLLKGQGRDYRDERPSILMEMAMELPGIIRDCP